MTANYNQKNKLSFFLFDLKGGGAERVIATLLNEMHKRHLNVDLILSFKEGPYLSELDPEIPIRNIKSSSIIKNIFSLYRHILKNNTTHLITTMRGPSIVALVVKILLGKKVKVIIREANTPSQEHGETNLKHKLLNKLTHFLYGYADSIVCVSEGVKTDFQLFYKNLDPTRITTIYNPVISAEFFTKAQLPIERGLPWAPKSRYFIAVGRFVEQKDYPTLLKAFELTSNNHDANLLILGDGPLREQFIAETKRLNLESRIHCPGFVNNPFPYMLNSSAFILSSQWEGLPNSLVQAVSLGLTTISTDCPSGPREILAAGKIGSLVPMQNAPALAIAMEQVLRAHPTQIERQHIKDYALEKFSVEHTTTQYINNILAS